MAQVPSTLRMGALETLLLLHLAASLLHFVHNAEYVQAYPNLPAWITHSSVYGAWIAITCVGVIGYVLHRLRRRLTGFVLLLLYAAAGLDGLLHYTRAPIEAHSQMMNLTIWFEAATATVLLLYLAFESPRLTSR